MPDSPQITNISRGHMAVAGLGSGKDFKLWPGGGRPWDWRETGTSHERGIQPADTTELLDHGSEIVVLTCGMSRALSVPPETIEVLEKKGITVHVAETNEAAALYNRLAAEERPVGGLFHSTC